jgi:hypothetical protein
MQTRGLAPDNSLEPLTAELFVAKVTNDAAAPLYEFREAWEVAGAWVVKAGGRVGGALNPAVAAPGVALALDDLFLCRSAAGDGGTRWEAVAKIPGLRAEEVDGTPSYTGASTLRFDQADGFSLSQPAAGVVRVDLLPASPSQTGVVTPANQDFGSGIKTAGAWRSQLLTDFGTFGVGGVTGYSHASNVALISTVGGAGAGVDMTGAWVFGVGAIYIVPDGLTTYTGQTGGIGPGTQVTCGLVTDLGSGTFVTLSGNNTWTGTNAFTGAVSVHPATDVSPLVLQGGGAGTADILDLKTAGGATVLSVTGAGNVTLGGNLSVAGVLSGAAFTGLQVSNYRNFF